MLATFLVLWAVTYYVLDRWTNSTVPLLDAFTNALSFVGLWALAHKYVEQWICWIVVDAICTYLYIVKGIPFKAFLYGLYVVIAILGYRKWNSMAQSSQKNETANT
jgi:nicotinamide mononucleotide transporter